MADTPADWERAPAVSPFEYLLVLILLPLAAAGVIALLAWLPAARQKGYEPGQSWRGESQWFGGPTKGVSAVDDVEPEALGTGRTGGTSGRW